MGPVVAVVAVVVLVLVLPSKLLYITTSWQLSNGLSKNIQGLWLARLTQSIHTCVHHFCLYLESSIRSAGSSRPFKTLWIGLIENTTISSKQSPNLDTISVTRTWQVKQIEENSKPHVYVSKSESCSDMAGRQTVLPFKWCEVFILLVISTIIVFLIWILSDSDFLSPSSPTVPWGTQLHVVAFKAGHNSNPATVHFGIGSMGLDSKGRYGQIKAWQKISQIFNCEILGTGLWRL